MSDNRCQNNIVNVSIVTVVHKAIEAFEQLALSLNKLDSKKFTLVVVINDGVEDNYKKICLLLKRQNYTSTVIVSENKGFAAGCNLGVRHVVSEYVWLLNSDCIVTDNSLISLLHHAKKMKSKFILGSEISTEDGRLQCNGGGNINFLLGFQRQNVKDEIIDYITGASLFMRRYEYLSLGGIDERFFLYWEETDFCIRAKNLGYRLKCCKESKVFHKIGASTDLTSDLTDYYSTRNAIIFFIRHSPFYAVPIVIGFNLMMKIINRIQRRQYSRVKLIAKAVIDGCLCKYGKMRRF